MCVLQVLDAGRGVSTVPLGLDRAFRRYWVFNSLPGLFVEDWEPHPGPCRPTPTPHDPNSLARMMEVHGDAIRAQACHNLSQPHSEDTPLPSSDKENAGPVPPRLPGPTYPASRPLHLANGAQASPRAEAKAEEKESEMEVEAPSIFGLCSANPETCPVHSSSPTHHRWYFFHKAEQLPPLIAGLNPRGQRERRLRSALNSLSSTLQTSLKSCPVSRLNPSLGALQVFICVCVLAHLHSTSPFLHEHHPVHIP